MKKVIIGCSSFLGAILMVFFLLIMGLGLAVQQGYIAEGTALPQNEIHPRYIKVLRDLEILGKDEKMYFFYSGAVLSIADEGNFFTNKRIVSYQVVEDEKYVYEASYSEVESIEIQRSDTWLEDSVITVKKSDGEWIALYVSTDSGGDASYYERLKAVWEKNKQN